MEPEHHPLPSNSDKAAKEKGRKSRQKERQKVRRAAAGSERASSPSQSATSSHGYLTLGLLTHVTYISSANSETNKLTSGSASSASDDGNE
jgi:hypothetical protein